MKTILVIDAQGGGLGKELISELRLNFKEIEIIAVGTNSLATNNMLKAGASHAATGENAVIVCAKKADIILGPVGIVITDAMYGEITSKMAQAICQSPALKILLPFNSCETMIAGIKEVTTKELIKDAIEKIKNLTS